MRNSFESKHKTGDGTPNQSKKLLISYVEDAPRSGRATNAIPETEEVVVATLSKNSTTRAYSTAMIAAKLPPTHKVSRRTVHRILARRAYRNVKPTMKPGLNAKAKLARLTFAMDHADWTVEDWKNIIWSDESSVQKGAQRRK